MVADIIKRIYYIIFQSTRKVKHSISSFTTRRLISSNSSKLQPNPILTSTELNQGCRLGLDSHADTSCAGRHVRVLEHVQGRECIVHPFYDSYKPIERISIINGALAYDTGT